MAIKSLNRIQEILPSQLFTPHFGLVSHPEGWLGENIRELLAWNSSVERMLKEGRTADGIANEFTKRASQQLGRSIGEVPEYLRVLIRLNTLGFIRYQQKQRTA